MVCDLKECLYYNEYARFACCYDGDVHDPASRLCNDVEPTDNNELDSVGYRYPEE